jgi:hypothetical protein
MGRAALEGILTVADRDKALRWHLRSNFYPPIDHDFHAPVARAVDLAIEGNWQSTILLPNGKVLSVASIVEQLRLGPIVEAHRPADAWAPFD